MVLGELEERGVMLDRGGRVIGSLWVICTIRKTQLLGRLKVEYQYYEGGRQEGGDFGPE